MPYHVERRRDLSDAKKCISAAESREQAHAKGTLGRASRGVRKGRKLATSKGRRRQVAVVWDEETQTYRWPHDDEESSSTTGAPKAPRQPADQGQTIVSARQDATESHPGQMDTIGIADSGTLNVDGVDDDDDDEEVATRSPFFFCSVCRWWLLLPFTVATAPAGEATMAMTHSSIVA